jgi:2,4-didehydro-3-deoxy-L-rhamnonate hydrolase
MRLIRFGAEKRERPGILFEDGKRRDLSAHFPDWDRVFFESGGIRKLRFLLRSTSLTAFPEISERERWGAPIARPGKVVCIGLNYSDHAAESGMPIPREPVVFLKGANTVVGPYDDILIPRGSLKTDWEIELGVVIGRSARYLAGSQEASECIAGYCISHDVSEREFQMERGGQWTKGKSCDTFNPLGPWLSTCEEVENPQALGMTLRVNGTIRQRGSTATMIFGVAEIIRYLSQFMTLEPGDLLTTGTPSGVGLGMKPPQYLSAGDIVQLEIEDLGMQRQTCVRA